MTPELEREWHRLKVFRKWKIRRLENCLKDGHHLNEYISSFPISGWRFVPDYKKYAQESIIGNVSCGCNVYQIMFWCYTCKSPPHLIMTDRNIITISHGLYAAMGKRILKKLQGVQDAQSEEPNRDGAQS